MLLTWRNKRQKNDFYSVELKPLSGTVTNRYWKTLYPWFGNSHVSIDRNRINTKRAGVFFSSLLLFLFANALVKEEIDDEKLIKLTTKKIVICVCFLFIETRNPANNFFFMLEFYPKKPLQQLKFAFRSIPAWIFCFVYEFSTNENYLKFSFYLPWS